MSKLFRLSVRYAAGHTQDMKELTADQITSGARGFVNDLIGLRGEGIRSLTVSLEEDHVPCDAVLCHGPGHQSRTRCEALGKHEVHYCFGGEATWRDGTYHARLRAAGIEPDPENHPPGLMMTGIFDELPEVD
jgi:hypothetical protein